MKSAFLILSFVLSMFVDGAVYAHAGEHESGNCFTNVGDTRLRLNGYYFDNKLAGKHFCRIFPLLGQIVMTVDVLSDSGTNNQQLAMNLSVFSGWSGRHPVFSLLKEQPAKAVGSGLLAVQHSVSKPGLYVLDVDLLTNNNLTESQRFYFLAGVPIAKAMIYLALVLLVVLAFVFFKKPKSNGAGSAS